MSLVITLKKARHKARVGLKVWRENGSLGFVALLLEFFAKYIRKFSKQTKRINVSVRGRVYTCVRYEDALRADFHSVKKNISSWQGTSKTRLTFNWLMPPPGKGSGGHLNIFRFIQYLERNGHTCRIYLYSQMGNSKISDIRAIMGNSYPKISAKMAWLDDKNTMEVADGIFATSWETAYASFNAKNEAKRFYFVQDFEPYFYPVGGLSTLAENTYRFGFYGITAGGWLAKKLKHEYGMETDNYNFGSDGRNYTFQNHKKRKEILFYARPYTERRGFELGIMALDLFHKKYPDYVINMVGYDVSSYDLPFPYKNLKTLEVHELSSLYNKCAAALVLSFTNMSLLPLELLACGTIPVVNDGENNRLVSSNSYIAYTNSDPISLANSISNVVDRDNLPLYAEHASRSVETTDWETAGRQFVEIVERETRKHG